MQEVGFNQLIKLDWLEQTAELALANDDAKQIQAALDNLLGNELSVGSGAERTSRSKTITVLLKIWVKAPLERSGFRNEALELFGQLPRAEHLALHWGATIAAYPFFAQVAETVGKLGRLQENFSREQIRQRLYQQHGERATVDRALRRVLGSLVNWQVIQQVGNQYNLVPAHTITNSQVISWLLEAVLRASGSQSGLLQTLSQSAILFPFKFEQVKLSDLENNSRLETYRQGINQNTLSLKATTSPSTTS
jgi:hypothetical protein